MGRVAADFAPQMRMIRILVPLATPPYIIATSVTPSGIMVVMSETDSTVDFVESVERNTKRGKKKENALHPTACQQPIFSFGRQGFPLKSVEGVVELYRPYTYVLSYVSSDSTNSTVVFQLFTGNGIKASHFLR